MANNPGYDVSVDTIFISGLPEDTTEDQLADHFGQIGVIKYDKKNDCKKIWIYKDKTTGKGKGEATITYDDPPTATSAISWFNGKEFRGSKLTIELAQRKSAPQFNRGGGTGGGGFRGGRGGHRIDGGRGVGSQDRGSYDRGRPGGGGGSSGRPGDWLCPSCNNNNFAYRQECNRCRTQKPQSSSAGDGSGSHNNGSRYHEDSSRGSYTPRGSAGGGSNYRDNDLRDRAGRGDGHNRDRESYRDRDRSRGGSGYGGSGGGPSRSHMRGKDDRRQRPY